jgi:hypothetical protein
MVFCVKWQLCLKNRFPHACQHEYSVYQTVTFTLCVWKLAKSGIIIIIIHTSLYYTLCISNLEKRKTFCVLFNEKLNISDDKLSYRYYTRLFTCACNITQGSNKLNWILLCRFTLSRSVDVLTHIYASLWRTLCYTVLKAVIFFQAHWFLATLHIIQAV